MTLYEFKLIPEKEKYHITFTKGDFVDYHLEAEQRFALYAVDRFFVEIEYNLENNRIVNLISFVVGSKLDRYSNLSE